MRVFVYFLFFLLLSSLNAQSNFPDFPPDNVTSVMDRNQMMEQLGISFPELQAKLDDPNRPDNISPNDSNNPTGNWTDEAGNLITRSDFGLWNNYNQMKTADYVPIDLLKLNNKVPVEIADDWWRKRRPEIKHAVENEIWGVIPADSILPFVSFEVEIDTGGRGVNTYLQKEITGHIDTSRYPQIRDVPKISAVLRVPEAAKQVPVMIVFGGFGNVLDRYWEIVSPHGWGVCVFNPGDLQPDNGRGLTSYLIGLVNKGNWRTPQQWGTLAAWGWGISRLIDYFEMDEHVNEQKIGLTGHSRYGKATLVSMAYESRIAIAFPSCAGALGSSMIRRHWGQDLENIAWDREYHWVAGNFFKYMGPLNGNTYMPRKVQNLTVDAHSLLALCAPRPVFLNGGVQDSWADFYGTYLAAKGASAVYNLLGKKGIIMPDDMPKEDVAYLEGDLAYRYHNGGHSDAPDWPAFFEFASKYIKTPILEPSSTFITLGAGDSSSAVLRIKSNRSWRAYRSEGWFFLDKKAGRNDDSIKVIVKENKFSKGRAAKIKIRTLGIERTVFLNQASKNPTMEITNSDLEIAAADNPSVSFEIKSNTEWNIKSSEDWLYPVKESGANGSKIVLKADDNPGLKKRNATITVSSMGVKPKTFKVTQKEGAPTLKIKTSSIKMSAANNSTGFWASSNTNWKVLSTVNWLTTDNKTGGNGFARINISAKENPGPERTGQILIKVKNLPDHVIEVIQAGK